MTVHEMANSEPVKMNPSSTDDIRELRDVPARISHRPVVAATGNVRNPRSAQDGNSTWARTMSSFQVQYVLPAPHPKHPTPSNIHPIWARDGACRGNRPVWADRSAWGAPFGASAVDRRAGREIGGQGGSEQVVPAVPRDAAGPASGPRRARSR